MERRAIALSALGWLLAASIGAQRFEVRVAPSVRIGELAWNIADSDGKPDVLSELTWSGLTAAGLEVEASAALTGAIEAVGRLRAGWILTGDNRDSDYLYDGREGEYSRSDNDASDGAVWDASVALGYRFDRGPFSVLPLVGLEAAQQRLSMSDGYQSVSVWPSGAPLGPFAGLDSSYVATWWGPWAGLEGRLVTGGGLRARAAVSYHLTRYYAWADWNLRTDFEHPKSFDHRAWGRALSAEAAFEAPLSERAFVSVRAEMVLARATDGTDRTFWVGGYVGETRLNEVSWRSFAASAGLRFELERQQRHAAVDRRRG